MPVVKKPVITTMQRCCGLLKLSQNKWNQQNRHAAAAWQAQCVLAAARWVGVQRAIRANQKRRRCHRCANRVMAMPARCCGRNGTGEPRVIRPVLLARMHCVMYSAVRLRRCRHALRGAVRAGISSASESGGTGAAGSAG